MSVESFNLPPSPTTAADALAWANQLADFVIAHAAQWEPEVIERALDSRDRDPFDAEWVHTDQAIRQHLGQLVPQAQTALEADADALCKHVFASVLKATGSDDAAGYVSEDFALIYLGLASGFASRFLTSLVTAYQSAHIPCGECL